MATPETLERPHRAALTGAGFIGPVHVEALRRIGVEVVGVLGSTPERTRPLARRLSIPRVYVDLDDLLGDPATEVVHITSPNEAHFAQAAGALRAGKHVLCEKPLANRTDETRALVELARGRPALASAVNYNVRFYPLCHEMRERVAAGDLGRLLSVSGSYTQDWLIRPEDYNWRVQSDGGANLRAVADIGTHWMDLAQFVAGRPIRALTADLATFHKERLRPTGPQETFSHQGRAADVQAVTVTTDDYGAVLFRMDGDVRGLFHASQMTAGRKNRLTLEVAGTLGSLAWDSEVPDRLWVGRRETPSLLLQRDPALLSAPAAALSHYPGGHAEGFPDTFKQLALAVYRWIDAGPDAPKHFPTFDDGHREVALCEAIAASARDRAWVDLVDDAAGTPPREA